MESLSSLQQQVSWFLGGGVKLPNANCQLLITDPHPTSLVLLVHSFTGPCIIFNEKSMCELLSKHAIRQIYFVFTHLRIQRKIRGFRPKYSTFGISIQIQSGPECQILGGMWTTLPGPYEMSSMDL